MSNTELIRELRALTSAGMKDCKDALEEAGWDLQKAVDIVKVKGQNISDGRSGRVAAEGVVAIVSKDSNLSVMVEVNCQTDFVANSEPFSNFARDVADTFHRSVVDSTSFEARDVESYRKNVVSSTKENVVVRRWWAEQATNPTVKVFSYMHSNSKIGVLVTLQAPSETAANSPEFKVLGNDLAMQIAAMNPLAVTADRLDSAEVERQRAIFETQLKEDAKPKPVAMWPKIIEGKFRKWNTEVCLLEQESVIVPKTQVRKVISDVGASLGGEITVVNFVRCQVGEGIEKKEENFLNEVAKLSGVHVHGDGNCHKNGNNDCPKDSFCVLK